MVLGARATLRDRAFRGEGSLFHVIVGELRALVLEHVGDDAGDVALEGQCDQVVHRVGVASFVVASRWSGGAQPRTARPSGDGRRSRRAQAAAAHSRRNADHASFDAAHRVQRTHPSGADRSRPDRARVRSSRSPAPRRARSCCGPRRFCASMAAMPVGSGCGAAPTIRLKTSSGSTSLYIGWVALAHETLRLLEHGSPSQLLSGVDRPTCREARRGLAPERSGCCGDDLVDRNAIGLVEPELLPDRRSVDARQPGAAQTAV